MAKNEVRFLNPPTVETKKKKYCRFKKLGIKYRKCNLKYIRSATITKC